MHGVAASLQICPVLCSAGASSNGRISLLDLVQLPKHCWDVAHQVKPPCRISSGVGQWAPEDTMGASGAWLHLILYRSASVDR